MSTPVTSTNYDEALRARLVAVLRARQWIRTQPVADAMGSLAKETFLPGADLTLVYSVDDTVPVKRNANDHTISSASAPWLVAYMLEEARQQTTVSLATLSGLHAADTAARVRHATERILMTEGQSVLGVDVVVAAIL